MDEGIYGHTQDGSLLCGGDVTSHYDKCSEWNSDSGTWNWKSINLPRIRRGHTSWTPQSGVGTFVMGGDDDAWKTNLVNKPDGSVELYGFNLHESTRYQPFHVSHFFVLIYFFKGMHALLLFLKLMKSS